MAKVKLGKARSKIEYTASELRITIPSKKSVDSKLLEIAPILFWIIFGLILLLETRDPGNHNTPKFVILLFIGVWIWFGVSAIHNFLWGRVGKEIITISKNEFKYVRQLFFFIRSKEYDLSSISKLRVQPYYARHHAIEGMPSWEGGVIEFDYGYKTHRFGEDLDEAEANYIVETIKQQYKDL